MKQRLRHSKKLTDEEKVAKGLIELPSAESENDEDDEGDNGE